MKYEMEDAASIGAPGGAANDAVVEAVASRNAATSHDSVKDILSGIP